MYLQYFKYLEKVDDVRGRRAIMLEETASEGGREDKGWRGERTIQWKLKKDIHDVW